MKNIVLSNDPVMLVIISYQLGLVNPFKALKINPVNHPINTRTIQVIKSPRDLFPGGLNKSAPKAWAKLVIPNTAPRIAPPKGPIVIAPIITGIPIMVIDNPVGSFIKPRGVNANSNRIAVNSASCTIFSVRSFDTAFIISSFHYDCPHYKNS